MRAHLTTLLLFPALGLLGQSTELVTLRDATNTVVNGGTVTVQGAPTDPDLDTPIVAELNGAASRTVNVLRRELNEVPGSQNYLAWGMNMFAPLASGDLPTWVCPEPLEMAPGSTGELYAYYRPNGTSGNACFRFVWYDVDAPMDSAWVNICFDTQGSIGVEEIAVNVALLDAYPNPATAGADVSFAYHLADAGPARLVVRNAQGARAVVVPLTGRSGRITLPTATMAAGMWHASLEQEGRALCTRPLVVAHWKIPARS